MVKRTVYTVKLFRSIKRISPGAFVIFIAAALIWAGRESSKECAKAAALCISVLIPSLFAFTGVSKLLIQTETYKLLGRPFSLISRYILHMPEDFFPVFLISQLAGYPIGAALINEMKESGRLSESKASELLCFCIAPGPAYIMAVSAAAAPRSSEAWIAVMLGVTGANLIAALVTAPFREIPEKSVEKITPKLTAEDITSAARSASESMIMICAMVLLMAAIMGIFTKARLLSGISMLISRLSGAPPAQIYPFARSFFEISNLCGVFGDSTAILPLTAAFLSFGGLCVHMQISAVCSGFSPLKAFIWRIPCAVISYFICRSFIPKFCVVSVITVSASVYEEIRFSDYSPLLSIILLIMTILILSQKNVAKQKKI